MCVCVCLISREFALRFRNLLFCQGELGRSKCDVWDLPPGIVDCCEAVRFEVRRVRCLNEGGSFYSY